MILTSIPFCSHLSGTPFHLGLRIFLSFLAVQNILTGLFMNPPGSDLWVYFCIMFCYGRTRDFWDGVFTTEIFLAWGLEGCIFVVNLGPDDNKQKRMPSMRLLHACGEEYK
jgi:hypothetical protein